MQFDEFNVLPPLAATEYAVPTLMWWQVYFCLIKWIILN